MTNDVWQNRIVGEDLVAAGELVAHPQNWRKHPKEQGKQLAAGLGKVGWVQRVIVNKRTGRMLDGHLRAELARTQGEATPVPVVYVDLSEDEERTVLATLDPIAGMAIADEATLAGLVRSIEDADLRSIAGSMAQTLNVDVDGTGEAGRDTEAQVDRAEELRQKWGVEPGQLWQLGEHRLICGDCTDAAVVARVMGGEKAQACVTDPPYGIGWDTDYTRFTSGDRNTKVKYDPIRSDDKPFDPSSFLNFDSVVLWGANFYADKLPVGSWLIWDKREDNGTAWLADAEVAWMKGGKGVYICPHTGPIREGRGLHPTQKRVDVVAWCIEKSKALQVIFDPFSGSGTTLIACENLGRRCRAVEIAPGYVAVALERWATHTGKVPTLVEGTPSGGDGDAVKAGAGA